MRLVLILYIAFLSCLPVSAAEPQLLAVVVAKDIAIKNFNQRELMLVFKKKLTLWENGQRIQAVNLPPEHPARKQFSMAVLKSLPEAQSSYWNDMYYHGVSPPHVLSSPEAVLKFVAETKGAIGYVPACMVDEKVQAIIWIDENLSIFNNRPELLCH